MIRNDEKNISVLTPQGWDDYALLDSGNGRRLEKFSTYKLVRPDKQAIWQPELGEDDWRSAHAEFKAGDEETGGRWLIKRDLPRSWPMKYRDLDFMVHMGDSKSVGVFPEQAVQWNWMREQLKRSPRPANILNLFGYTGLATVAAASEGSQVTHVDASKYSMSIARENLKLSRLSDRPVRWIIDDALKFVKREFRRDKKYDGIIMDPPKFGRGPKGEIWDVLKMLPTLLEECSRILTAAPLFLLITVYAVPISAITLRNLVEGSLTAYDGCLQSGEMGILESSKGRVLPTAIFARWYGC